MCSTIEAGRKVKDPIHGQRLVPGRRKYIVLCCLYYESVTLMVQQMNSKQEFSSREQWRFVLTWACRVEAGEGKCTGSCWAGTPSERVAESAPGRDEASPVPRPSFQFDEDAVSCADTRHVLYRYNRNHSVGSPSLSYIATIFLAPIRQWMKLFSLCLFIGRGEPATAAWLQIRYTVPSSPRNCNIYGY